MYVRRIDDGVDGDERDGGDYRFLLRVSNDLIVGGVAQKHDFIVQRERDERFGCRFWRREKRP